MSMKNVIWKHPYYWWINLRNDIKILKRLYENKPENERMAMNFSNGRLDKFEKRGILKIDRLFAESVNVYIEWIIALRKKFQNIQSTMILLNIWIRPIKYSN